MAQDTTIIALIVLAILDGIALLISIFFLIKSEFRYDKLTNYLQFTFPNCCDRIVFSHIFFNIFKIYVMTIIVLFVLMTPYIFHLIMGIIVFTDSTMLPHIGIGIFTLGWLAYSFFIALGHWYYKFVFFFVLIRIWIVQNYCSFYCFDVYRNIIILGIFIFSFIYARLLFF